MNKGDKQFNGCWYIQLTNEELYNNFNYYCEKYMPVSVMIDGRGGQYQYGRIIYFGYQRKLKFNKKENNKKENNKKVDNKITKCEKFIIDNFGLTKDEILECKIKF